MNDLQITPVQESELNNIDLSIDAVNIQPVQESELNNIDLSIDAVNIQNMVNTNSLSCIKTINDFKDSLKKGQEVEDLFDQDVLISAKYGSTVIIEYVGSNPKWKNIGVDYTIHDPKTDVYKKVELKTSISNDGNSILLELCDRIQTGHLGWYYHTSSDIIIFYKKNCNGKVLGKIFINWNLFRPWFESNKNKLIPYVNSHYNESTWFGTISESKNLWFNITRYELDEHLAKRTVPWLLYNKNKRQE